MSMKEKYFPLALAAAVVLVAGFVSREVLERIFPETDSQSRKSISESSAGASTRNSETDPKKSAALAFTFVFAVTHVERGAPAERAGLRTGDLIVRVNGTQVSDVHALDQSAVETGTDTVSLRVFRPIEGKISSHKFSIQPDGNPRTAIPPQTPALVGGAVARSELGISGVFGLFVIPSSRSSTSTIYKGLELHDVVFRVDKEPVTHLMAIRDMTTSAPPGTEFALHLIRVDGEGGTWKVHSGTLKSTSSEKQPNQK